ncbi:MAG: LysR family transcriptional regulator [Thermoactinospora sp.]|nr:LysR family transcriptional regulator [Thermoactinospora sp.]
MELRDIEIFLTLAEELHFGRTAARLHVTPARVSQAIKQQERRIGGALFERSSRAVRLTPLGTLLRADLEPVYRELRQSLQRARMAARGVTATLRVGMIPDIAHDLRPAWEAFRARHPECRLQLVHSGFVEPFKTLRDGEIGALIAWLPVEEPDLTVGPVVYTEPRVLTVAVDHPLAERGTVSMEVFGDDHPVATALPYLPDYWEDAFNPFTTSSGRPVDNRVHVATYEQIQRLVGTGQMIHPIGAHASRYFQRPDVVYLPIHDAPAFRWGLIWRTDGDNRYVHALARVFRDLGTNVV